MKLTHRILWSFTLVLAFGGAACSQSEEHSEAGSGENGQTGPQGTGGAAAMSGSGGEGTAMSSGGAVKIPGTGGTPSALPQPDCPAPVNLGVRLVGRYDGCTAGGVRMAWSGTGFIARFEGTGLTFTQSGNAVQYTVLIDQVLQPVLQTQNGQQMYEAASGLIAGEHVIEVYRRGEASFGTTTLLSVDAVGGTLLDPPAPSARRIEIFGDSITCGYGNEGDSPSCPFSADTENHYLSYGAILARQFGAELSTVAWSGKGVVVNYGGDMSTTIPEMADRAIPESEASIWDYSLAPAPQLVVLNLGTNDFSTDSAPTEEEFSATYLALLRTLRARYPSALLLCTIGPLLTGADKLKAESGIASAVQTLNNEGDAAAVAHAMQAGNPNPGCDWHPAVATHETMAQELGGVVSSQLGW